MRFASVLLALAVGLLIAGCGGSEGSPEDAVQGYFDAATGDDFDAACDLLSASSLELIEATGDDCPTALASDSSTPIPDDFEIGETTEDGDTATVAVSGGGEDVDIPVVDEDGEWKVDLAALVEQATELSPDSPE